jgi:alpha-N-acetylglucosamine transferase
MLRLELSAPLARAAPLSLQEDIAMKYDRQTRFVIAMMLAPQFYVLKHIEERFGLENLDFNLLSAEGRKAIADATPAEYIREWAEKPWFIDNVEKEFPDWIEKAKRIVAEGRACNWKV